MRATADYIALHARRRPHHPALAGAGWSASFATLARSLRRVTAALSELELAPGSLVAVSHEDLGANLLLMLGFEWLGIAVGQFLAHEEAECAPLLSEAALIVVSEGVLPGQTHRILRIDPEWWRREVTLRPDPPSEPCGLRPVAGSDPVLLFRTSGTTGAPKRVLLDRRMLETRIRHRARVMRMTRDARCLVAMPTTAAGSYYMVTAALRLGATLVRPASAAWWPDLVAQRITHTLMLPLLLGRLLDEQPADAAPLPGLSLCVIGARLTTTLRRRASRLCGRIVSVYSSSEAGTVCVMTPQGEGDLLPGVQVEVVDEAGRHLPRGAVGRVVIKSESVATEYFSRNDGSGMHFREGWFHSGDVGRVTETGRLVVLGRQDDVLNLGGLKVPCGEIEDTLLGRVRLRDVAVFMQEPGQEPGQEDRQEARPQDRENEATLMVCAVFAAPCALTETYHAIREIVGREFSLWLVDEIPRTPEGKIRRRRLRELVGA